MTFKNYLIKDWFWRNNTETSDLKWNYWSYIQFYKYSLQCYSLDYFIVLTNLFK